MVTETLGISVGILLMFYGVAIGRLKHFRNVNDYHGSVFLLCGLVLILIATDVVLPPFLMSLSFRVTGYLIAAGVGTYIFVTLARNPDHFGTAQSAPRE